MRDVTSVGVDVHAGSSVAVAIDDSTGEVVVRRFGADAGELVAWVQGLGGAVEVAYEAGPTGFVLARRFEAVGVRCVVAAPSKIRRASGERVKTDRRDAELLARLLQVGQLAAVHVPTVEQEAARDLVRSRDDARRDLTAARHRLGKLLLRHGVRYTGGGLWTARHHEWLQRQKLGAQALQATFDTCFDAMIAATDRRDRLDVVIEQLACASEFTPVVRRLGCLRGISTLTAFGLAVEIGDWTRLDARRIGSYLGLTPSEHSSGQTRRQGAITKTGNRHVRRLLIEAAWHHRRPYRTTSTALRNRWAQASVDARRTGHRANTRLHERWRHYDQRHKNAAVANTAIARELAGWCWQLATTGD